MSPSGFKSFEFSAGGYTHRVYSKGQGSKLVLMHELPGLTEPVVKFAERLIDQGFEVFIPHLFGKLMSPASTRNLLRLCISKEFGRLKSGVSAPVVDWLRELTRYMEPTGKKPVGVIGMCVTGAFVIPLILETSVRAGVVSQPAIPFSIPYKLTGIGQGAWMQELNIADADLNSAALHAQKHGKLILVQRFNEDRLCPHARVERIALSFGESATLHEYPSPMPPVSHPHALLTEEYEAAVEDDNDPTRIAFKRVVEFFHTHLTGLSHY